VIEDPSTGAVTGTNNYMPPGGVPGSLTVTVYGGNPDGGNNNPSGSTLTGGCESTNPGSSSYLFLAVATLSGLLLRLRQPQKQ